MTTGSADTNHHSNVTAAIHGTLTFLGTGTSVGVPMVGCSCPACRSTDPRDNRMRSSVLMQWHEPIPDASAENDSLNQPDQPEQIARTAVIDTTPEFRLQLLREKIMRLDAVLVTHNHADHIHGLDDVRPFCFLHKISIPIYGPPNALEWIRKHYAYIWESIQKGGGLPKVDLYPVENDFDLFGLRVTPLPVMHGILPIYGYRFGDCAYISDVSKIPDETFSLLKGLKTLIVDAVRYLPHSTHFHLDAAIDAARRIGAEQTYFTHMNHDFIHERLCQELPESMAPAYDGLKIWWTARA